ncbi:MAG: alkylmercury lyase [Sporichthyaceae bacterium]
MELRLLSVPDCPNAEVFLSRLAELGLSVEVVTMTGPADAESWGMAGSPTLLVDGRDPFAEPGTRPSVSCRLYRGGLPSVDDLRAALGLPAPGSSAREP